MKKGKEKATVREPTQELKWNANSQLTLDIGVKIPLINWIFLYFNLTQSDTWNTENWVNYEMLK